MGLCESLQVLLSGFIDGELTPDENEQVKQHLEECHRCALKVIAMNQMRKQTAHIQFQDPPPEEWDERAGGLFEAVGRRLGLGFYIFALILYVCLLASVLWSALIRQEAGWKFALVGLSLLAGTLLLFAAALVQRLRSSRTDRYKDIIR